MEGCTCQERQKTRMLLTEICLICTSLHHLTSFSLLDKTITCYLRDTHTNVKPVRFSLFFKLFLEPTENIFRKEICLLESCTHHCLADWVPKFLDSHLICWTKFQTSKEDDKQPQNKLTAPLRLYMQEKEGTVSPWGYDILVCFVKAIHWGKIQIPVWIWGLKEHQPFLPTASQHIAMPKCSLERTGWDKRAVQLCLLKWILLVALVY